MPLIRYARLPSPLGDLLVTDHGEGLSGLYFEGHRRGPAVGAGWREDRPAFATLDAELAAYWRGELRSFTVPLDPRGTPFQRSVWDALRGIAYGATTTYGGLATAVGRSGAARAVAGAVARNPLSIVVPCHRVVGADGSVTGYAGGVDRKRWLLALEADGTRP